MAERDRIIEFLDELLDAGSFADYGPNGLQVPGADEIETVVTGVSAQRELFTRAAGEGAQLVIAHHGMFWESQPRALSPAQRDRLRVLIEDDISLAAYPPSPRRPPGRGKQRADLCAARSRAS